MKIFITGATGFIGSHLVRRLKQTGHQLFCLVRKNSDVRLLEKLGVTLVIGDVTDKSSVLAGMKGCDWVMNLANVYSFWEPDQRIYTRVNVEGTRNVMECALETGISKVVHTSSVVVYGKPQDIPFAEESPEDPPSQQSKFLANLFCWQSQDQLFQQFSLIQVYANDQSEIEPWQFVLGKAGKENE